MKIYRAMTPAVAAMACMVALPAMAQVATHSETNKRTVTPVEGNVSTNKTKVVHIKKTVPAAPQPATGGTVHTSKVTKKVHKTSVKTGGQ